MRKLLNLHPAVMFLITFLAVSSCASAYLGINWGSFKKQYSKSLAEYNEYANEQHKKEKISLVLNYKGEFDSLIFYAPEGFPKNQSEIKQFQDSHNSFYIKEKYKSKSIYRTVMDEEENENFSFVRRYLKLDEKPNNNQILESKRISSWTGISQETIIKEILKKETNLIAKEAGLLNEISHGCSYYPFSGCPEDPLSFNDYMWNNHIYFTLKIFSFITIAVMGAWFLVRRITRETNKGWLRLSIATSLTGAVVITIATIAFWFDAPNPLVVFVVAIVTLMAMMLFGSDVQAWVRDGYARDEESKGTGTRSIIESKPETAPYKSTTEPETNAHLGNASFGRRFYARCIDTSIIWILSNAIGMFIPNVPAEIFGIAAILVDAIVFAAICCVMLIVYDTFFIHHQGQTLGKKLLGVKVQTWTGEPVPRDKSFKRARDYLSLGAGYMIFFPFLQVSYAASNRNKLLQGKQTSWDEYNHTRVMQKPISKARYVVSAVIAWSLILGMFFAISISKEVQKKEVRQQAIEALR